MEENIVRCGWLNTDPIYIAYHDQEWGIPVRDSFQLFEALCLEGQQAGLSWLTILKKRTNYRNIFRNFDPYQIVKLKESDVNLMTCNTSIVRHKGKIQCIINNAKCFIEMESNGEDFSSFIWNFVKNDQIVNHWQDHKEIPADNSISDSLSMSLKKKGFKYVGSRIVLAFMQACGLFNDHIENCAFKYK